MPARGKKVSEKQESCRGIEGLDHRWVPGEVSGAMYCSKCGVAKDLADAKERLAELFGIARPAEAEGAVQCPASHPAECYAPGTQVVHANLVHGIVRQADALSASLSAVTAEAERLQAECLALLSERDQLRAEVERLTAQGEDEAVLGDHNLIPSLQAEVEALRAAALFFYGKAVDDAADESCGEWDRHETVIQSVETRQARSAEHEDSPLPEPAGTEPDPKCTACYDYICGGTGLFDGRKCYGIPF